MRHYTVLWRKFGSSLFRQRKYLNVWGRILKKNIEFCLRIVAKFQKILRYWISRLSPVAESIFMTSEEKCWCQQKSFYIFWSIHDGLHNYKVSWLYRFSVISKWANFPHPPIHSKTVSKRLTQKRLRVQSEDSNVSISIFRCYSAFVGRLNENVMSSGLKLMRTLNVSVASVGSR